MCSGVRPIIFFASIPTASGRPSRALIATTDGSSSTTPRPRTYTRVFAVPRSTAMSRPITDEYQGSLTYTAFGAGCAGRVEQGYGSRSAFATRARRRAPVERAGGYCQSPSARRRPRCVATTPHRGSGDAPSEVREEEGDLAGGRFGAVAAVDQVLGQLDGEVATDRAGRGVTGVCRAHQRAHDLPRIGAFDDHRDERAAGDERDEVAEERLAVVLRVVLLRRRLVEPAQFERDQRQAFALQAQDDFADEAAFDGVGLAQHERAVVVTHEGERVPVSRFAVRIQPAVVVPRDV